MADIVGTRKRVTVTFKLDDVATAPGDVTIQVRKPDASVDELTPTNPSTGVYVVDVDLDQAGKHVVRVEGTDPVVAADEVVLVAQESQF